MNESPVMNTRYFFRSVVLVAAAVSLIASGGRAAESSAEDLLDATGFSGGLVVHLGCGDPEVMDLTADLGKGETFLVHGLDRDEAAVRRARTAIQEKGVYGRVSVERLRGDRLPYADNLVNVIVVDDVEAVSREELMRVLVPEGVALIRAGGKIERVIKPRPATMDEWTHFMHEPDNNPVAHDSHIGPPDSIQWMATPKFSRAHEQQSSFSACVSSGGRMFYILDDAPRVDIRLPSKWVLIARDAFNGVKLWEKPMGDWVNQYRRFRSGPANLPFRLVADDDKVFVTLDFSGPVHILDAKSGETLRVLEGTEKAKQIIYQKGVLTLLIDDDVDRMDEIDAARRRGEFLPHQCRIMKVHVETGEVFWKKEIDELVFPVMALKNGRVFAQTPSKVFSLDYESGSERWNADFAAELPIPEGKLKSDEMQWEAPTLIVGDDIVYVADFKKVVAYGAEDGQVKWAGASKNEYNAPPDLLLIGDLLWTRGKSGRQGLNPLTGEVIKEVPVSRPYMHPRCYRAKATDQYLLLGEMGVRMIDVNNGDTRDNDWIRGTCQYGVMPANGLLYVPPDSCACNMKTKLSGLYAFASTGARPKSKGGPVLEKGPAYGTEVRGQSG